MAKPEIIGKLDQIFSNLDDLHDTAYFQISSRAHNHIEEALVQIVNAIDAIKKDLHADEVR